MMDNTTIAVTLALLRTLLKMSKSIVEHKNTFLRIWTSSWSSTIEERTSVQQGHNSRGCPVRKRTVTPDLCSARFMLHCEPEVGWVSWRSIWSCGQSYGHATRLVGVQQSLGVTAPCLRIVYVHSIHCRTGGLCVLSERSICSSFSLGSGLFLFFVKGPLCLAPCLQVID